MDFGLAVFCRKFKVAFDADLLRRPHRICAQTRLLPRFLLRKTARGGCGVS